MPTTASTRLGLIGPSGTDTIASGDDIIRAIITELEAYGAGWLQGTAASRNAAGAGNAGFFYIATDTGVVSFSTGSVWIDVSPRTTTVTSLPGSPIDGQEIYYLADATNGIVWHLKYRAASASTYKWEYVGGDGLYYADTGDRSTASSSDVSMGGSTLTLPLAGDYAVEFGGRVHLTATNFAVVMKVGTGTVYSEEIVEGIDVANSDKFLSRKAKVLGAAAAAPLRHYGRVIVGGGTQTMHQIDTYCSAHPLRVG